LNMLAAFGLIFLPEETTFWMLVSVVEFILPRGYYTSGMEGAQVDQRVLREILQERFPKLHTHFERLEIDLSMFTFNWMLTLFLDAVPPPTAVRIWDCIL
jgi:hypothetical protein